MKKMLSVLVLSAAMVASVFAGGARETVTVEGKLVITDSIPTIVNATGTWVLPGGPFYQLAYLNGIKAGDTVKAEGYEETSPADFTIKNAKFLMPVKVSVNGKEIDLSSLKGMGRGGMRGGCPGCAASGGMMGGRFDDDDGGFGPGGRMNGRGGNR